MGVSPAKFDSAGQSSSHYIPGNYSRRNTIGGSTGVSNGNVCIIGTSMGGKPRTLHVVSDKAEAQNLLGSGTLLDGVVQAFNGSNTFVPQQIFCIRVNNGTQASRTMQNGGKDILTIKTADYGTHMNQLKMWLKDGTSEGKKITAIYKATEIEIDNIAKKSFSVMYTGNGTSALCAINDTGLTITTDVDKDNLTVTWEEAETLEALVSRINDTGVYSANILDTTPDTPCSQLDHVPNTSVMTKAHTFNSDLQALIDALKGISFIGGNVTLEGKERLIPENDTAFVYFSGAEAGTSTVQDWADTIALLEKEDINIIATPTTDKDIHSLIVDHCVSMSSVTKKKERTCWVGTPTGTSIEDAVDLAKTYNSELCSLVCTHATANNPITGASEEITPAMLACKCAGIEGAIAVSNPLTNKAIKVSAFGQKYTEGELNKMITGGVVPFGENDDGELVCIRCMTTYQGDSLIQNERSMIRSVLYMDRDLRKAYNRRIGTNEEPSESTVIESLKKKAKEWYDLGLLSKSNSGELVENPKVRFDGDKTYLTYDRYIRAPVNFTFITPTNKIYTSTQEL